MDKDGNCNCGRPARKPMRMRIVNGKKVYLDDAGQPIDESLLAPPLPLPKDRKPPVLP